MVEKIFAYVGFFLLSAVIGYITGNSLTSVSGIAVAYIASLLGSVVTAIIKINNAEELDRILARLGILYFVIAVGLIIGIFVGSILKGRYLKKPKDFKNPNTTKIDLPPISHNIRDELSEKLKDNNTKNGNN